MTRALLLYNPLSGRFPSSPRRIRGLASDLIRWGISCTLTGTPPPPRSRDWPALRDQDLLIVHGGDGTIHRAMGQAVRYGVPLGILPAGTANVLARELGIPLDPRRAVGVVGRARRKRIHLGQAGEDPFLLMAGIGFDACVLARTTLGMKRALGVPAYWLASLVALASCPLPLFSVETEGSVFEATFAVLGNASSYGGQLRITPAARLEEPCLDLCLFRSTSRIRYLSYLLGVATGTHLRFPDVVHRKVDRVRVRTSPGVRMQTDGELCPAGTVEFRPSPETLEVLVP